MWSAIVWLYTIIFYQPILNALVAIYNVVPGHDFGITIVILTIIIRIILYPLSLKSIRAQKQMTELQPKLEAIKKQYANNKEKQAEETMRLYREEKINPLSSCLPLLLQLPFLLALFHVFRNGTDPQNLIYLYPFIKAPASINHVGFFGLLDLTMTHNIIIAVAAGAAQYWQAHMLVRSRPPVRNEATKDEDFATMMNQQMMYVMPAVTAFIAFSYPSGLGLYWFLSTFLLALQQWFLFHRKSRREEPPKSESKLDAHGGPPQTASPSPR